MTAMLPLGWLVAGAVGGCGGARPVAAPAPREKPVLKCELHWTGKFETTMLGERITTEDPQAAEITITNISDAEVDIGSNFGPLGFFDLKVKDPAGAVVKTEPLSSRMAVQTFIGSPPKPYILKAGEAFRCPEALLIMVPADKRVRGTYKVKAVYTFKNKEYESAEVEVKWPGK